MPLVRCALQSLAEPSSLCGIPYPMAGDMDPLQLAEDEARALYTRMKVRALDWAKQYLTAALLKVLVPAAGAVALALVALPAFAAGACVVMTALLALYSINATRLLKRKDAELRWAWVANKRLHQRHLDHQIATDNVILELMGERTEGRPFRFVPQELRSALAHVRQKTARRQTASTPIPIRASIQTDRPAEGPALGPVKARRAAREAEHEMLTAEIESLATPEDVERAMKADETKRTQRERQDAAMKADKAARDRARAGLRPTAAEPEHTIMLNVAVNGDHKVGTDRRGPTPEQIAAGQ
jgi:hypothetical protein